MYFRDNVAIVRSGKKRRNDAIEINIPVALQWRHNEGDGVSNHLCLDCLANLLFRRRSKKTPKLCVTGLCDGSPSVTDGFPSQWASNAEDVSHLMTSWCVLFPLLRLPLATIDFMIPSVCAGKKYVEKWYWRSMNTGTKLAHWLQILLHDSTWTGVTHIIGSGKELLISW